MAANKLKGGNKMPNRITGTNSGIDVDAVVKSSLTTEQNKIDKAKQQEEIYAMQQDQLRSIVNDCNAFYDKYLDVLSGNSLMSSSKYQSVSFTQLEGNSVTAKGLAGAEGGNYEINVSKVAKKAQTTISADNTLDSIKITVGDKTAELTKDQIIKDEQGNVDYKATASRLNEEFSKQGINMTAKYSQIAGGLVIESKETGEAQSFELELNGKPAETFQGEDCEYTISKDGAGTGKVLKSASNTIVMDNIEFSVAGTGTTKLNGKIDGSQLKDTLVNFINDYNKLITDINTKVSEKRDKNYQPLTDEQREAMSDSEIEKWEKKVAEGQLRNDEDLVRIQSSLKQCMRTFMSESGLNLEAIGISPVDNYGTKNGTFSIDENKLQKAIEEKPEDVKNLFIKPAKDGKGGGIMVQLQKVLKDETKSSSSSLSKRIGFIGTATENSNTLTKKIQEQQKLAKELKAKYTTKENALYKKYSSLESMMEKMNAQSGSLYSMLGIG